MNNTITSFPALNVFPRRLAERQKQRGRVIVTQLLRDRPIDRRENLSVALRTNCNFQLM